MIDVEKIGGCGMTENEAIKEFKENIELPFGSTISKEASEIAISALEEIQQYRALGTVGDIKKIIAFLSFDGEASLIDDMNLLNQYHMLGTVEELREVREKQRAKKPLGGVDIDGNEYAICRECSAILSDGEWFAKYCPDCGQAIDWSEEE